MQCAEVSFTRDKDWALQGVRTWARTTGRPGISTEVMSVQFERLRSALLHVTLRAIVRGLCGSDGRKFNEKLEVDKTRLRNLLLTLLPLFFNNVVCMGKENISVTISSFIFFCFLVKMLFALTVNNFILAEFPTDR